MGKKRADKTRCGKRRKAQQAAYAKRWIAKPENRERARLAKQRYYDRIRKRPREDGVATR